MRDDPQAEAAPGSPAPPVPPAPPAADRRGGAVAAGWGLVAVLLGVSLLVRNIAAAPPPLVAATVALPALWGLALLVLLGFALFARRPLGWGPVGVAVLVQGLVWGRAWLGWPQDAPGRALRVVSWNVQRLGWEDADHGERLACVSARLDAADPDAMVLLEVSARDVARLAGRLDLDCEHTDYRGTGAEGHGGLAVCARGSRWRLARKGPRQFVPDIDWYYVFGELVSADGPADPDLARPGEVFNLVAVHLQPYGGILHTHVSDVSEAQADETAALLQRVSALRDPTIVAGDFNSARDASVHVRMRRYLVDAFEQAGWGPGATVRAGGWLPLRIDYVYATDTFAVREASIPAWDCSDHRPVVADLVVRE